MSKRNTGTMLNLLLVAEDGAAGAAMRDVIESLAEVDVPWDVREISEVLRLTAQMHPDIVLLSHSLLREGLLAVIRASASRSSRTKILVISVHNDSRLALRAIEAGASGYVLQDRIFEELAIAVRTIMSGRTYLSPGIAGVQQSAMTAPGPFGGLSGDQTDLGARPLEM